MNREDLYSIINELKEAIKALEAPFLALPEHGLSSESEAYRRGARDAYIIILKALEEVE
jgi:hypothetical protein